MDPVTAGVMAAASTGLQVVSSITAGNAAARSANWNAAQMDAQAARTLRATNAQEEALRRQQAKELGRERAAWGQSGLAVSGSPLDAMTESARLAELDALNLRYGGIVQANDLRNQAQSTRWEGRMARRAGYIGAGTALLSGASQFAGLSSMGSTAGKSGMRYGMTGAPSASTLPKVM